MKFYPFKIGYVGLGVVGALVFACDINKSHADAPWVKSIDEKIDQADAAIEAGQWGQALAIAQAAVAEAEADAHEWGMVTDMDRAAKLRKDALLRQLKIALHASNYNAADAIIEKLQQGYPEQDIPEVRQAMIQLRIMSVEEAAQIAQVESQAMAVLKAVRYAWNNPTEERSYEATLRLLRPIFADEGAGLQAQMLAAEFLLESGKTDDAIAIWAKLWKQLPKEAFIRDKVQMRLWQVAGQNGHEDLFREVCAEAINGRDIMFRMAARSEWLPRLRKMRRYQEVVNLVEDTLKQWDIYLQMVGRDDESDALEAIFGLEAGIALKALGRYSEARPYFERARAAAERLPEARSDGRPIRIKRGLIATLKIEMR